MGRKIHHSSNLLGHVATRERQPDSPSLPRDPCKWSILWWEVLLYLSDISSTILAKNVGTISKTQHEIPPRPHTMLSCCFVYVQSEWLQWLSTLLGRGGFQEFGMTVPPSLWWLVINVQNKIVHLQRLFRICPRKYWPGLWVKFIRSCSQCYKRANDLN